MTQLVGVMMLALGIIVIQVIRHRAQTLYPTTLLVRFLILVVLIWLYQSSHDPLFLIITGIVAFGFILTSSCYLFESE